MKHKDNRGTEKTYGLEEQVNWLTARVRGRWPGFCLEGELLAQGEDYEDRWKLVMVDGVATKALMPRVGQKVECPRCGETFTLEAI